MRVGVVSFSDVEYGIDLANGLSSIGIDTWLYLSRRHVCLAVNDWEHPETAIRDQGYLPPAVGLNLFKWHRMRDPRSLPEMGRLSHVLLDKRTDVVHLLVGGAEIWMAVLAALVRKLPVVSTMIIPRANTSGRVTRGITLAVNYSLASRSDVVIVNGQDHSDYVRRRYRVAPYRILYVPLGPRTMIVRSRQDDVLEDPNMVLFFGRVRRHKGLEYLIRAQPLIRSRVAEARIVVAGIGDDLDRCRGLARGVKGVEFVPEFLTNREAATFFQRASLVVLPYISAATSGVLLNAYGFAKPVVATRVGNLPEYVEDGVTGLLVPSGNVAALADAITRLLSDPDLRHQMGRNAAGWLEQHLAWDRLALRTREAYERALARHSNRGNTEQGSNS